eukprot:CFRG1189T1
MAEQLVVVGDCGGTNTRLSLWSILNGAKKPKRGERAPGTLRFDKKYQNENYSNFIEIAQLFIQESNVSGVPAAACLACAGPILNNSVNFTNIKSGWFISGEALQKDLSIAKVLLVNDFTAMGYGLLTLSDDECLVLNDAKPKAGGVVATIGAGTGLGECFLTKDPTSDNYSCWATEGGHADWAPHTLLECEILDYARKKFCAKSRVSVERIVSGPGISLIYEFLSLEKFPEKVNVAIHNEWENGGAQRGGIVAENAKNCELCAESMKIFFNAYASEAGNAMLKWLPTGGFYLTGGINVKNMEYYTKNTNFIDTVLDKGRMNAVLSNCPVLVVKSEDVGERGAHLVAFNLLTK